MDRVRKPRHDCDGAFNTQVLARGEDTEVVDEALRSGLLLFRTDFNAVSQRRNSLRRNRAQLSPGQRTFNESNFRRGSARFDDRSHRRSESPDSTAPAYVGWAQSRDDTDR